MEIEKVQIMKNIYKFFGIPLQKVNLFGFRDKRDMEKDIYNDWIGCFTPFEFVIVRGTTDPGVYYTNQPMNKKGCAHLCLGYHKNIWRHRKHAGRHMALCNDWRCGKQKVWRDTTKDFYFDGEEPYDYGILNINLHKASDVQTLEHIGRYSAGCQVVQSPTDFDELLRMTFNYEQKKFSYLLLSINDMPDGLHG